MGSSFGDQLVQLDAEILLFIQFVLRDHHYLHDLVVDFRFIGPHEVAVPSEELALLPSFRFGLLFVLQLFCFFNRVFLFLGHLLSPPRIFQQIFYSLDIFLVFLRCFSHFNTFFVKCEEIDLDLLEHLKKVSRLIDLSFSCQVLFL